MATLGTLVAYKADGAPPSAAFESERSNMSVEAGPAVSK
jgi:hypothetical protein